MSKNKEQGLAQYGGGERRQFILSNQVKEVIEEYALKYADQKRLSLRPETLKKVIAIITACLHVGLEGKPEPTNLTQVKKAITEGLEKRTQLLKDGIQLNNRLRDSENQGRTRTYAYDLGLSNDSLNPFREEINQPLNFAQLSFTKEMVERTSEGEKVLKAMALKVVATALGLSPEEAIVAQVTERIKFTHEQAVVMRGLVATSLLWSQGHQNGSNPLFFRDQDLENLIQSSWDLSQNSDGQRELVEGLVHFFRLPKEVQHYARGMILGYLHQVMESAQNWSRSHVYHQGERDNPNYWFDIRRYFEGMPLDPLNMSSRFAFNVEDLPDALANNSLHLWSQAALIQGKLVPSAQDLLTARQVLKRRANDEVTQDIEVRVRRATAAWSTHAFVMNKYPRKIEKIQTHLSKLEARAQELIPTHELPEGTPPRLSDIQRLKRIASQYDKAISQDAQNSLVVLEKPQLNNPDSYSVFYRENYAKLTRSIAKLNEEESLIKFQITSPSLFDLVEGLDTPTKEKMDDYQLIAWREKLELYRRELLQDFNKLLPDDILVLYEHQPELFEQFLKQVRASSSSAREVLNISRVLRVLSERQFGASDVSVRDFALATLNRRIKGLKRLESLGQKKLRLQYQMELLDATLIPETQEWAVEEFLKLSSKQYQNEMRRNQLSILPKEVIDNVQEFEEKFQKAKRLVQAYRSLGGLSFKIMSVESDEFVAAAYKQARMYSLDKDKRLEVVRILEESLPILEDSFIPLKEAREMTLGDLMKVVRRRTELVEALLYHDQVQAEIAHLELLWRAYREIHDYTVALNRVKAARFKIEEMQHRLTHAEEYLLKIMERCEFVIDPKGFHNEASDNEEHE